MPARLAIILRSLALWLAMAGPCAQASSQAPPSLLPTLLGESCTLERRDDLTPARGMPPDQALVCAGRPTGLLGFAPLLSRGDLTTTQRLESAYRNSESAAAHRGELRCADALKPLAGARQVPVLALPCRRTNGGWQHLVLITASADVLRIVDGPPSALPAMVAALVGPQQAAAMGAPEALLESLFGERVPLASAADLDRFRTMTQEARAANGVARYEEAERLFRRALDLQSRLLSDNDPALAQTLMDLALNVSNQGRDEEALALFRRAEPIIQRSPQAADRARFAVYQGYHAANFQRHDAALRFARAAVAGWRAEVDGPRVNLGNAESVDAALALDRGELALALNLLASMALRISDLALAQASASEALQIVNSTDGLPGWWRADILLTLGRISIAQGRLSAAETFLGNSLETYRRSSGDSLQTLPARLALAGVYQTEGLPSASLLAYRELFELLDRQGPDAAVHLKPDDLIAYGSAVIDRAAQFGDPAERQPLFAQALEALQRVRPAAVDKTLLQARERMAATEPGLQALLERLRTAERQRTAARIALSYESTLADGQRSRLVEDRLNQRIATAEQTVAGLHADLQAHYPQFRRLGGIGPRVAAADLQQRLAAHEAVLSFVVGERATLVQLVRRDSLLIRRIDASESMLQDEVAGLRRSVDAGDRGLAPFDHAAAWRLYRLLFTPIELQLQGIEHLTIIPGGALASLPFAVLLTEDPAQASANASPAWLIRRTALAYAPSLQAFAQLRDAARHRTAAPDALLGVGDPLLSGQRAAIASSSPPADTDPAAALARYCRQEGPADPTLLRALAPLPDTAMELRAVADVLRPGGGQTTLLARGEASERRLREQVLSNYRVIYFATHGLLPGELRCRSEPALVLTPEDAAGQREQDGLLEASEIASLRLNADLVVLSACNTAGFDQRSGGDSLSGLAEAFLYAGARSLLASHWQVASRATTALMTRLFGRLGPDVTQGSAEALRQAQLALSTEPGTAHPFFWAAFTLIGDGIDRSRLPSPPAASRPAANRRSGSAT